MAKISMFMAVLLVTASLLADSTQALTDLLHLIPGVGNALAAIASWLVDIVSIFSFYIWLKLLNVSFVDPKRAIRFFGVVGCEWIPGVDVLPLWTTGIVLTIASVWAEERIQTLTGVNMALNSRLAAGSKKIPGRGGVGPNTVRTPGGSMGDISKSMRDYKDFKKKRHDAGRSVVGAGDILLNE